MSQGACSAATTPSAAAARRKALSGRTPGVKKPEPLPKFVVLAARKGTDAEGRQPFQAISLPSRLWRPRREAP